MIVATGCVAFDCVVEKRLVGEGGAGVSCMEKVAVGDRVAETVTMAALSRLRLALLDMVDVTGSERGARYETGADENAVDLALVDATAGAGSS